jgi:arylsulfatase A-like enzyme
VPLVARYPAAFPAGNRVGALTQTHDVVTTIYELAGADSAVPGIAHSSHSLLRALRGDARTYTLCDFAFPLDMLERSTRRGLEFDLRRYYRALKGFRSGDWKYIWADDGRDELYNLAEDPTEQINLIESQRDRARAMYDQLDAVLRTIPVNDYGDWLVTEYMKEVPRDSWEKLQRWGYLRRGQADRPAFRRDTA